MRIPPKDKLVWQQGYPVRIQHGFPGPSHVANQSADLKPCGMCFMRGWDMTYIEDVFPEVPRKLAWMNSTT